MKELGDFFPPRGCPHSPSPSAWFMLLLSLWHKEDVTVGSHFCLERRCSLEPSEGTVVLGAPEYGWCIDPVRT